MFGLIKQEPGTHSWVPSALVSNFEMLNFYQDMNCVFKHNPFKLASKITVSIKYRNNAKKTKIVNRKMLLYF